MARLGFFDKEPEAAEIAARAREQGATIDAILDALADAGYTVARSTVGKRVKTLDELRERVAQSRAIAEAIAKPLADRGESRALAENAEILHALITQLTAADAGEEVTLRPKDVADYARALKDLATASAKDTDLQARLAEAANKARHAAAEAAVAGMRRARVSPETIARVRQDIYCLEPETAAGAA